MKLCALLLGLAALILLGGCDVAHGPVIFNATDHAVDLTVHFADGPSQVHLDPNQAYWQLKPGRTLESLVVDENAKHREFGREELLSLLKQVATPDDALLLVRTDRIAVRSVSEAKREGFFDKR